MAWLVIVFTILGALAIGLLLAARSRANESSLWAGIRVGALCLASLLGFHALILGLIALLFAAGMHASDVFSVPLRLAAVLVSLGITVYAPIAAFKRADTPGRSVLAPAVLAISVLMVTAPAAFLLSLRYMLD